MIKWIMKGYNKVVSDIKVNLPPKSKWLVQVSLNDSRLIGIEYMGYSVVHVKDMYRKDLVVYNGLLIGEGVGKKYIKKKDISRLESIALVDE